MMCLHLVLNRSEQGVGAGCAGLDGLGELDHLLQHLIVDILVDVDTLGGDTDLAGVLESTHDELWSNLLDVDVGQNDGGIVATELKGHTLESAGSGRHDFLASGN